eukprot:CAMPEP_0177389530 /NCGR_PEP_ID=MMETSP0368-20130122/52624_1 /TAXON_ID=447022 ORGANISM="Scrippsiella hangoei-like, Strain SHHI-4" /NCGR_SAMPLE_ID=MMETSP0368 /ASSEMBLY_ACC=CAM_ASM_000363 /LENGTH=433 /DNA_ID=CAMNT_0018854967 /DNA_START=14 /DNA_END=1313 /DNA_ORIENTATION=-
MAAGAEEDAAFAPAADSPLVRWLRRLIERRTEPGELKVSFQGRPSADEGLQVLADLLPDDLTSLEVELPASSQPSDAGVKVLLDRLEQQTGLVAFGMRCNMCAELTGGTLQAVSAMLANHLDLTDLLLDFSMCAKVGDDGLAAIGKFLGDRAGEPPEEGEAAADAELEGQGGGEKAAANMDRTSAMPSKDTFDGERHCRRPSRKSTAETQKEKEPEFALLACLDLNFHGCLMLSDDGLDKLVPGLTGARSCRVMRIDLGGLPTRATSSGFKNVFGAFATMSVLAELFLNVRGSAEVYDSCLVTLCSALLAKEHMRSLHLNFHGCSGIATQSLFSFKDPLRSAKKLENIFLDFSECTQIHDKGFQEICTCAKALPELKRFVLHIGGTQISNVGLADLEQTMKGVPDVKISRAVKWAMSQGLTFKEKDIAALGDD